MNLISFLSGIYMISFAASSLFFLKFYKSTGERLFKYFSFACFMLAVERIALFFIENPFPSIPTPVSESESWVYFFRLIGFLVIVYAIVEKNRRSQK
jgi:hypothetical protein